MVEWSITTVLKTVVLRGTGGSNPSLSANKRHQSFLMPFFVCIFLGEGWFRGLSRNRQSCWGCKNKAIIYYRPHCKRLPAPEGEGTGVGTVLSSISLYLPLSPSISLHLPLSPSISLYLPLSPFIYFPLITDPTPFPAPAGEGNRREKQLSTRHFTECNP